MSVFIGYSLLANRTTKASFISTLISPVNLFLGIQVSWLDYLANVTQQFYPYLSPEQRIKSMTLNVVYKAPHHLAFILLPASFLTTSFPYPVNRDLTREGSWALKCVWIVHNSPIHFKTSVPCYRKMSRPPFIYATGLWGGLKVLMFYIHHKSMS